MSENLFGDLPEKFICIACGADKEPDPERSTPGVHRYKPCPCGAVGMRDALDLYESHFKKKAFKQLYERR